LSKDKTDSIRICESHARIVALIRLASCRKWTNCANGTQDTQGVARQSKLIARRLLVPFAGEDVPHGQHVEFVLLAPGILLKRR
jgi:hypothetical protein